MRSFFVKEKERLFKKCLFRRRKQWFGWLPLIPVGWWGALLRGVYHVFCFYLFIYSFRETMEREPPTALKPKLEKKSGELRH